MLLHLLVQETHFFRLNLNNLIPCQPISAQIKKKKELTARTRIVSPPETGTRAIEKINSGIASIQITGNLIAKNDNNPKLSGIFEGMNISFFADISSMTLDSVHILQVYLLRNAFEYFE